MFDILIIGSGPSGMTCAIYGARMNLKVAIIERNAPGGQMVNTAKIENYPGFSSIDGATLSMNMYEQMTNFGVEFIGEEVEKIEKIDNKFIVKTNYNVYDAKTVVIATGTKNRKLGVIGEDKFTGRGISWCAICDGSFYKGKEVIVVGGGNSALEEAIYLSSICKKVYIVHRRDEFRADKMIIENLEKYKNVSYLLSKTITEFASDNGKNLTKVKLLNLKDNSEEWFNIDGVFEFVGQIPNSEIFKDLGIVNEAGYIEVDKNFETKIKGLFASGDIIDKGVRQIATAINDGAISALNASRYIK